MNHEERWQLAVDLTAKMVETYPDDIVLAGVYGSTARETDTKWSDLELLFVTRKGCRAAGKHFILRGIAVGYRIVDQPTLEDILIHPTLQWSFYAGTLSVLRVLHGDPAQVRRWIDLARSVPPERFRAALSAALPELVVESFGRILSCRERGNTRDIGPAVREVLHEMSQALCLLNGRWVTHDYFEGLTDTFDFPKLPDGYRDLVPTLWSATDFAEIVPLAERLLL